MQSQKGWCRQDCNWWADACCWQAVNRVCWRRAREQANEGRGKEERCEGQLQTQEQEQEQEQEQGQGHEQGDVQYSIELEGKRASSGRVQDGLQTRQNLENDANPGGANSHGRGQNNLRPRRWGGAATSWQLGGRRCWWPPHRPRPCSDRSARAWREGSTATALHTLSRWRLTDRSCSHGRASPSQHPHHTLFSTPSRTPCHVAAAGAWLPIAGQLRPQLDGCKMDSPRVHAPPPRPPTG